MKFSLTVMLVALLSSATSLACLPSGTPLSKTQKQELLGYLKFHKPVCHKLVRSKLKRNFVAFEQDLGTTVKYSLQDSANRVFITIKQTYDKPSVQCEFRRGIPRGC